MKLNEMCVRKKQVRPGIYKALCDGYIRMRAGLYRVPVGTFIMPDIDLVIVKTKHGSVCWQYESHRNWWIGRLLPLNTAVKKDNQSCAITQYPLFIKKNTYEIFKIESDGIIWALQKDDKLQAGCNLWIMMEAIRVMVA